MSEEEIRRLSHSFLVKTCALLLLWTVLSWLVANAIQKSQTSELIQNETAGLASLVSNTAESIDLGLDYLHGIPALVANDELLAPVMARFGSTTPSGIPYGKREAVWTDNSSLKNVDNYLRQVSSSLGADVVWITNAAGDCIASSNAGKPESFVGTNYADREYFKIARNGKPGRQYAMGRKTNIPGLFFSSPIMIKGRFAGAAVAKIDLPRLRHWVSQTDSFISDEHGVIILARDQTLVMRALPVPTSLTFPELSVSHVTSKAIFRRLKLRHGMADVFPRCAISTRRRSLC